jgi:hypothetical protein
MVEPQSPLKMSEDSSHTHSLSHVDGYGSVPEVGDDLVARVGDLLVLLGCAAGDLELVRLVDAVGAVGRASDFTAIEAMAENLYERVSTDATVQLGIHETHACSRVAARLVTDVTAHASTGSHCRVGREGLIGKGTVELKKRLWCVGEWE